MIISAAQMNLLLLEARYGTFAVILGLPCHNLLIVGAKVGEGQTRPAVTAEKKFRGINAKKRDRKCSSFECSGKFQNFERPLLTDELIMQHTCRNLSISAYNMPQILLIN